MEDKARNVLALFSFARFKIKSRLISSSSNLHPTWSVNVIYTHIRFLIKSKQNALAKSLSFYLLLFFKSNQPLLIYFLPLGFLWIENLILK
jgi:hypothetical protein